MGKSRRSFLKTGLASVALMSTVGMTNTGCATPARKEKATNPFRLGMAGFTFVNFDLETTLKTLQRLDVHYLCIKDFHLPFDSTDEQIKAFHEKCASYGV